MQIRTSERASEPSACSLIMHLIIAANAVRARALPSMIRSSSEGDDGGADIFLQWLVMELSCFRGGEGGRGEVENGRFVFWVAKEL